MEKHFLITGIRGSGKTRMARQLVASYNPEEIISFTGSILSHGLGLYVTRATKVLILDEIKDEDQAKTIIEMMKNGFKVQYKKKPTAIFSPRIICICQKEDKSALDLFLQKDDGLFALVDMDRESNKLNTQLLNTISHD